MLCVAIAYSTMIGSTVVACSTLGGSAGLLIGCSAVVAYSILGGFAGSLIGCSTIFVASGTGAEKEGYSELAIELTNRSRTSCLSSNSSRTITGVCVGRTETDV